MILAIVNSICSFEQKYSCKSICLQITAEVSKITKSVQSDLPSIYIELSETTNSFVKIRLRLKIDSIASFIKIHFY